MNEDRCVRWCTICVCVYIYMIVHRHSRLGVIILTKLWLVFCPSLRRLYTSHKCMCVWEGWRGCKIHPVSREEGQEGGKSICSMSRRFLAYTKDGLADKCAPLLYQHHSHALFRRVCTKQRPTQIQRAQARANTWTHSLGLENARRLQSTL